MKLFLALSLLGATMTAAMPNYKDYKDPWTTSTSSTAAPATTTSSPFSPTSCGRLYCYENTSYCQYWGGVTGYQIPPSRRPLPGMTSTSIGVCNATTSITPPATSTAVVATTANITSPAITSRPPYSCVIEWCGNGTSSCEYWGGITAYDPRYGPKPGMVLTTLGPCSEASATETASSAVAT